jgi:hypothetical protein
MDWVAACGPALYNRSSGGTPDSMHALTLHPAGSPCLQQQYFTHQTAVQFEEGPE